jgi:ABC-type glutathione transport system ATPase component
MSFAREVADHVVFMDGGVVVEQGDPKSVINNPQHARTKSFLSRMQAEHHAVEHVPASLEEAINVEIPRPGGELSIPVEHLPEEDE